MKVTARVEDYVEPDYYDRLLKEYAFSGKTDLDLFGEFLTGLNKKTDVNVLELGSGTGRGTEVVLKEMSVREMTLVDLSQPMLAKSRERFSKYAHIEYQQSDTLDYLKNTKKSFDLIFSLWSYSHSVYQLIEKIGLENGLREVKRIITKMFHENMRVGSSLFIIHSDWLSDEQQILVKQWGRDIPGLYKQGTQGLSKLALDSILEDLHNKGQVDYSVTPYVGDCIEYSSLEEALEVFINFHLESHFNNTEYIKEVFDDLREYLIKFQDSNGKVLVRPACFIYKCAKIQ
ncbi:MAG: class I SAM-dependent methyltransferase [Minisyncoccia bacterium]